MALSTHLTSENENACPIILNNYSLLCSICGDGYPCFEISAVNADKPPLSVSQIKDRVKQFEKVGESIVCLLVLGATVYLGFSLKLPCWTY